MRNNQKLHMQLRKFIVL